MTLTATNHDNQRLGEICPTIRSAVLIQITRVTDGRTDGIGVAYTRYNIYAVASKNRTTYRSASRYRKDHSLRC